MDYSCSVVKTICRILFDMARSVEARNSRASLARIRKPQGLGQSGYFSVFVTTHLAMSDFSNRAALRQRHLAPPEVLKNSYAACDTLFCPSLRGMGEELPPLAGVPSDISTRRSMVPTFWSSFVPMSSSPSDADAEMPIRLFRNQREGLP